MLETVLLWIHLREQTIKQWSQSHPLCLTSDAPPQLVLDRGLLDACSDSVFREAASSLLSAVDWPQGDLSLPQVPAPNRPPLLTVKHDRWSSQARRHTSEQASCLQLSWIALSFPGLTETVSLTPFTPTAALVWPAEGATQGFLCFSAWSCTMYLL